MSTDQRDEQTLAFFREFLRIPSTSHLGPTSGSYVACVDLLEREAKARGFETARFGLATKPVLLCTRRGSRPELQSVLLNSHYDVVSDV
jgi:acetylornithine deacetylase/succinyl-diaminopimelate desuccinylase-like protein